MSSLRKRR
jgi:hypothetical protein